MASRTRSTPAILPTKICTIWPPEEDAKIPTVCSSLDQALDCLDKDREFLTRGGVFSNDFIDAYIALKMDEVNRLRMTTHPVEFSKCITAFNRAMQKSKTGRKPRFALGGKNLSVHGACPILSRTLCRRNG